jgi:hypothetical protein
MSDVILVLLRSLLSGSYIITLARTGRWTKIVSEARAVEPTDQGNIIALPMVSGLHYRYARQVAA